MRKVIAILSCVAALVLTGCNLYPLNPSGGGASSGGRDASSMTDDQIERLDNKTEKCWHVTTVITKYDDTKTTEGYFWGTEYEVAKACQEQAKLITATYQQSGATVQVSIRYGNVNVKTKESCDKLAGGSSSPGD